MYVKADNLAGLRIDVTDLFTANREKHYFELTIYRQFNNNRQRFCENNVNDVLSHDKRFFHINKCLQASINVIFQQLYDYIICYNCLII